MSSSGNFLPEFGQESRQSAANRASIGTLAAPGNAWAGRRDEWAGEHATTGPLSRSTRSAKTLLPGRLHSGLLGGFREIGLCRVAALQAEPGPGAAGGPPGDHEEADDEEAERVDVQPFDPAPRAAGQVELLAEKADEFHGADQQGDGDAEAGDR